VCIVTDFTVEYKYISEANADISIKGGRGAFSVGKKIGFKNNAL
jgi:hypothetical protein